MYATEYAKSRNHPYSLILQLCREGKIPSFKRQKYIIDPVEADEVMEQLKYAPKHTPKQKQAIEKKQERQAAAKALEVKPKFNFLESLEDLRKAR